MSQNVGNLAQNFSVDSEYYPSIYEAATLPRINESILGIRKSFLS